MIKNRICLVPSVSSVGRLRHRGNNRMADLKQFCYNIDVAPPREIDYVMHPILSRLPLMFMWGDSGPKPPTSDRK